MQVKLRRDRFERGRKFGSNVEGLEGYAPKKFLEFGGTLVRSSSGFAARAFHLVAEEATRTEERGEGVELGAETNEGGLRKSLGGSA